LHPLLFYQSSSQRDYASILLFSICILFFSTTAQVNATLPALTYLKTRKTFFLRKQTAVLGEVRRQQQRYADQHNHKVKEAFCSMMW